MQFCNFVCLFWELVFLRFRYRQAQVRIEAALEQMNKDAKEMISLKGTWRRPANNKKVPIQREMNNIRVRLIILLTFLDKIIDKFVSTPTLGLKTDPNAPKRDM